MAKRLVMNAERVVLPSTEITNEASVTIRACSDKRRYVSLVDEVAGDTIELSLSQWLQLTTAVCVEDAPEPWQVLRCAVLDAAGTITPEPPGELIRITERAWRQAADALGIEPEGES